MPQEREYLDYVKASDKVLQHIVNEKNMGFRCEHPAQTTNSRTEIDTEVHSNLTTRLYIMS